MKALVLLLVLLVCGCRGEWRLKSETWDDSRECVTTNANDERYGCRSGRGVMLSVERRW